MELGKEQDEEFNNIKKFLAGEPSLDHYAKDRDSIVTTEKVKPDSEIHYGRNSQAEK